MFAFLCKTKNWSNGMRTYRFFSIFRNSKIYYYTYICRPKVALPWEPHLVHESELVAVLILCMIRTLSSSKEGKASTNLLELIFEWLEGSGCFRIVKISLSIHFDILIVTSMTLGNSIWKWWYVCTRVCENARRAAPKKHDPGMNLAHKAQLGLAFFSLWK